LAVPGVTVAVMDPSLAPEQLMSLSLTETATAGDEETGGVNTTTTEDPKSVEASST